jgi:hypothetical protein
VSFFKEMISFTYYDDENAIIHDRCTSISAKTLDITHHESLCARLKKLELLSYNLLAQIPEFLCALLVSGVRRGLFVRNLALDEV